MFQVKLLHIRLHKPKPVDQMAYKRVQLLQPHRDLAKGTDPNSPYILILERLLGLILKILGMRKIYFEMTLSCPLAVVQIRASWCFFRGGPACHMCVCVHFVPTCQYSPTSEKSPERSS